MADDTISMKDVIALLGDDAKAQRLLEISRAKQEHDQAKLAAEAQGAINGQMLSDANDAQRAAEKLMDLHAKDVVAFEAEKDRVAAFNNELNAEKARWDSMRQQAEEQMRARETAAASADRDLRAREAAVTARENAVSGREDSAQVMAGRAQKIIEWTKLGPDIE